MLCLGRTCIPYFRCTGSAWSGTGLPSLSYPTALSISFLTNKVFSIFLSWLSLINCHSLCSGISVSTLLYCTLKKTSLSSSVVFTLLTLIAFLDKSWILLIPYVLGSLIIFATSIAGKSRFFTLGTATVFLTQ